ncbi:MAG: DUF2179 domain-containing protein [Clostridia bacterium]|nr:DUF2179 domain-containing protein [Clostridia bacterium]
MVGLRSLLLRRRPLIYFIVNGFQVSKHKDIVHEIDPGAYISISEVADVFTSKHSEKE